ncbi:hypothetical protein M885DRAFT_537750 [Pelagophyceae sp. CCMP2097]|nr:hypothetical protein M885DRAFT_537750 [Pelagophyceae sp. CCMP2097]
MEVLLRVVAIDLDEDGLPWSMGEAHFVLDEVLSAKRLAAQRVRVVVRAAAIEEAQYSIPLCRLGITVKETVIELHPTTPGAWLWHDLDYYEQRLIEEIERHLGHKEVEVVDLIRQLRRPPVIRSSTRVFLRRWPDKFVTVTDIASGHSRVRRNFDGFEPVFH